MSHVSVLLQEVLTALVPEAQAPPARLIDGTLGAGGHTHALLEAGVGEALGLDLDPQAIAIAREVLAPFGNRARIQQASYAAMTAQAAGIGWADGVDAILLDLGVSSMQFDTVERGFSFRHEAPLDMRFDPANGDQLSAAALVNELDADELANVLYEYGEERDSRRIARAIIGARPLTTTRELAAVIERAAPRRSHDAIHPATRTFQALRIAVNDEMGVIERALPVAIDLLHPGGRLAVISFHSLEDRRVKEAFKLAATDCICPPRVPICICGHEASVELVTRKPITASDAEITANPRSRSAKLRVVEKLPG